MGIDSPSMESYSPKSDGSSVWGPIDTFQISRRNSPLTLNMMQTENMLCAVCNKRNETLVKREEIIWKREDIVHMREQELRERELLLQEKDKQLKDEETRLKCEEGRLKEEYDSEESRKWKNVNMEEYVSFVLQKSNELKNDFLVEKERLLQNKEEVNIEKAKFLQTQELELLGKEQVISNEKSIADEEKKLADERNLSLENREDIVKALEKVLHTKITEVLEKEKTLDERVNLIEEKENALSVAAEMIAKKESELHERENSVIEKEKNIIKQICEFASAVKSVQEDQMLKETEDIHIYFDKIINNKVPSLQQQENAIKEREKILDRRWKAYVDAQKVFKMQQKKILEEKNACEKEKLMLKEWSQILEKQDEVITKQVNSFVTTLAEKAYQILFVNNNISSDVFANSKTQVEISRNSSPFLKLGIKSGLNSATYDQNPSTEEVLVSQNVTVDSKDYENSGEEFFKFLEKEKEELQNALLSDRIKQSAMEISNKCCEGNTSAKHVVLTGTVQEFFDNATSNISTTVRNDQIGAAEINDTKFSSAINKSRTIKANDINQEGTPNVAFVGDMEVTQLGCDNDILDILPIQEKCIPQFTGIPSDDKEMNNPSLYCEAQGNVQNRETNANCDREQILKRVLKIKQDCVKIECDKSTVVNVKKHENASECSTENLINKPVEMDSSLKTSTECSKTYSVGESVSSCLSPNSTRSLSSPIPEDKLTSLQARKKKVGRDSLLQAIASGNKLEIVNLLDMNCLPLERRDDEGRSAFLLVAKIGDIELLERLIKMGADTRARDFSGNSALHIAIYEKNLDVVTFLINKGLDPCVTNNDGNTALELAKSISDVLLVDAIHNLISHD